MEVVERLLTMMKTAYKEQTKMNIRIPKEFPVIYKYFYNFIINITFMIIIIIIF